jgi:hypothetical protein
MPTTAQLASDTVLAMTDKQKAFIIKLIADVKTQMGEHQSPLAIRAREYLTLAESRLADNGINKRGASQVIENLLYFSKQSFVPVPVREKAPIGVYKRGDDIYRVVKGRQSQNTYAQKLTVDFNGAPTWVYVGGMIFELKVSELITPEVAAQMGRATGYCVICGRYLTDADSVAKGIGPVCAKNTSITYAQYRN